MFSLRLDCAQTEKDTLVAELWERGTLGVTEYDQPGGRSTLEAFFETPFDEPSWVAYAPEWRPVEERDWSQEWRRGWEPLLAGERFFIIPAWRTDPTPPGRFRIEVEPGMAFGTGLHTTTQLAIEELERWLKPGASVLDLGTGTGILALAATLLGAGGVVGCDIDREAVEYARRHTPHTVFQGSSRAVRTASRDLVVANINTEGLVQLAAEIGRVLRPGASAILGGFPEADGERVRNAFEQAGFNRLSTRERDGWISMVYSWQAGETGSPGAA